MTLVIAQKRNGGISFSSDSRISFSIPSDYIDYGVKIFSVPVKISSPRSSETGVINHEYSYRLGLAVIGSTINAYTVKETVYEILQNLQYIPTQTDLSMQGIANLVFKVFRKTTEDLAPILCASGMCELILGGYCPEKEYVRVFHFFCETSKHPIAPQYKEILTTDGVEFYGSGADEAKSIFNNAPQLAPLRIIKQVIKDNKVNTVGGGLQYGDFTNGNFNICGVQDYALNEDGSFKEYILSLRGIDLYKDDFERDADGFHIAYTFLTPFEDEINEILFRRW